MFGNDTGSPLLNFSKGEGLALGYDNSEKQSADHDGLDQPARTGLISVVTLILCGVFFGLLAGWKIYNDKAKRRQEANGSVVASNSL